MVYDAAIIGTGPAGISAALNLKIHQKSFIWIGSKALSDKIAKAEEISNYPGFTRATGRELIDAFKRQIDDMGIEITEGVVNGIYPMKGKYGLAAGPEIYEAKTVLLTTGVAQKGVLPGEAERLGRGVSYCATCDGMLYRGKTIAAISTGSRFEHEIDFLASLAQRVYFFPAYKDVGPMKDNVTVMAGRVSGILGEGRVSSVTLTDGSALDIDGIFILRDSISLGALLPQLKLEDGHIAVDRGMATNLPGVYAAGDCTGRPYQYAKAVGEGNVASHAMIDYLAELDKGV